MCILQILHYGHWDRHYRLCCVKLSCPSLIALFPVVFHSANFWKIQIFIDSNFKLTTTCCHPYISLGSFSKLIHNNMTFGLCWVRFGSDTLPWHMVSSFMIPWCLWMRHQSSNLNDKWQLLTLKPHKEIPWMVQMMKLKASPSLPTLYPLAYVNQPKPLLADKGYQVTCHTQHTWQYGWREIAVAWGRCGGGRSMGLHSMTSAWFCWLCFSEITTISITTTTNCTGIYT